MKKGKYLCMLLSVFMVLGLVAGCSSSSGQKQTSKKLPVVGISTGSSGTTYRDTQIQALQAVGNEYKSSGKIKSYKIVNNVNNGDATEQGNIIRNFINQGVNIILMNPNSSTALNGVIAQAQAAGILVMSYDGTCTAKNVITVQVDPANWGKQTTQYIASQVPTGTAIDIYGLDGAPGNIQRLQAMSDVLKGFPGIKMAAQTTGAWDETKAKEATEQILASGVHPDIIFTQDSEAYGVLSACIDENKLPKIMVGELGPAFYKLWKSLSDKNEKVQFVAFPNPPGVSGTAFRLAVNVYNGKKLKSDALVMANGAETFYYNVTGLYTDKNYDAGWALLNGKPDDYMYSEYISESDLQAYFQ
jgi:ribose transport system substrate-binding protein